MTKPVNTVDLASDFRKKFNLGEAESLNIPGLLYTIDVITVYKPLSIGFSGLSQITKGKKFMLINSNHSLAKQNFTICHELYHLYYQKDFTSMVCTIGEFNESDKEEYLADCFAADLLLPKIGILREIPSRETTINSITLPTLLHIENKFRCSRKSLLYRLKNMGLIDHSIIDKFSKDVKRGAAEYGYSSNLYSPTRQTLEVIGDYGDIARLKFDNDEISESHYISLLQDIGIDLDENIGEDVE